MSREDREETQKVARIYCRCVMNPNLEEEAPEACKECPVKFLCFILGFDNATCFERSRKEAK